MKYEYIIGIDPGVKTGVSCWDVKEKRFRSVECEKIHDVLNFVKWFGLSRTVYVRVEDARLRKWFGNSGREQLQGAGSIKRDSKIWDDFLTDLKIPFEMVAPKNNKTKLDSATFKKITGWKERTNEHSRDAAMLCYQFKPLK